MTKHSQVNPQETLPWADLKKGADGLVPVIVIDAVQRDVLMMAYMDQEAYEATLRTRRMTYHSRSRNALWVKGETSGHFQLVRRLWADCDTDTLLAEVEQVGGIACHTGARSCFFRCILEEEDSDPQML